MIKHRQLIFFTLIFIYIYSIGSKYVYTPETKQQEIHTHTSQRKIERQLPHSEEVFFQQTVDEDKLAE